MQQQWLSMWAAVLASMYHEGGPGAFHCPYKAVEPVESTKVVLKGKPNSKGRESQFHWKWLEKSLTMMMTTIHGKR